MATNAIILALQKSDAVQVQRPKDRQLGADIIKMYADDCRAL
jgi:hypothetical protein